MDTSQQDTVTPKDRENSAAGPRQRRSIAEKRRIVEETLMAAASDARVARRHGVNANQVFGWRRLYLSRTTWRTEARDQVAAESGLEFEVFLNCWLLNETDLPLQIVEPIQLTIRGASQF
jgi:transposase-like protein